MAEAESVDPLVELFGLSFHPTTGDWQFQFRVLARIPETTHYLIQYFEGFTGGPSNQGIVPLEWFIERNVKFYRDAEAWRDEGDQQGRRLSRKSAHEFS